MVINKVKKIKKKHVFLLMPVLAIGAFMFVFLSQGLPPPSTTGQVSFSNPFLSEDAIQSEVIVYYGEIRSGQPLTVRIKPGENGISNLFYLLKYPEGSDFGEPFVVSSHTIKCKGSVCDKERTYNIKLPEDLSPGRYSIRFEDFSSDSVLRDDFTILSSRKDDYRKSSFRANPLTGLNRNEYRKSRYSEITGYGNNLQNPYFGSSFYPHLIRISDASYSDGIFSPSGDNRPNPRTISNVVSSQEEVILNERGLSDMLWQWGQFLDHDITLTEGYYPPEEFSITIPQGDAYFDPFNTGMQEMHFVRSDYDSETGTSERNPRQQVNHITAFVDASNVYGHNDERAAALRTFEGGMLKTSQGGLYLPYNSELLPNAPAPIPHFYLAGDIRANEQLALLSMHTLFVREHNRIARELAQNNPSFDDETIYQESRRQVIALMQKITYDDWLPALLGHNLPEYTTYNPSVNPGIANEFSTALFRFGHSAASPDLKRYDENYDVSSHGHISLREGFFSPSRLVSEGGIEPLIRGLTHNQMQEIDTFLIDDLRNFLFGPPGAGGFDLDALNIQRGRDHGLPDYNTIREAYGLSKVESFDDITSNKNLSVALLNVYGSVDNVDVFIGALAEDHLPGSSVGELIDAALIDQFVRIRNGDRYWYEYTFADDELLEIKNTTLKDIIIRNSEINSLQDDVFYVK